MIPTLIFVRKPGDDSKCPPEVLVRCDVCHSSFWELASLVNPYADSDVFRTCIRCDKKALDSSGARPTGKQPE